MRSQPHLAPSADCRWCRFFFEERRGIGPWWTGPCRGMGWWRIILGHISLGTMLLLQILLFNILHNIYNRYTNFFWQKSRVFRVCLGELHSNNFSSTPPTPLWSSSSLELEYIKRVFGLQMNSGFYNALFFLSCLRYPLWIEKKIEQNAGGFW